MLEVIDRGRSTESHPAPLLFVHGANHAAWCWDEHFLDYYADRGYRAVALSLRGHGNSPTSTPLRSCSPADYVDDVASVADSLPARPVVYRSLHGRLRGAKVPGAARRACWRVGDVLSCTRSCRTNTAQDEVAPVADR